MNTTHTLTFLWSPWTLSVSVLVIAVTAALVFWPGVGAISPGRSACWNFAIWLVILAPLFQSARMDRTLSAG